MKKIILLLLLTVSFVACKKDSEEDSAPKAYTDRVVLDDLQVTADSVSLTWTVLGNPDFRAYQVIRREKPSGAGTDLSFMNDAKKVKFVDKAVPYTPYLEYQVVGVLTSGQPIASNTIVYERPEIKVLDVSPFDVQFNRERRQLYIFEREGKISIYDLESNQITKTIHTASTIGYSDFGVHNGVEELYVPRNDGWVFVYNARTLEKVDQINVRLGSSCVVANNNLLYVSTAAWTNRPLKVYSRETKGLVSETGDWDMTRMKKIPGSNTELVEITLNIGPTDQHYYNFSSTGNVLSHKPDRYHGDYPLDAAIFEIFPSGDKYITSSSGAIFNKDLVYEASLPRGNHRFTTFDFDEQNQLIFGGTRSKTIEVYAERDYSHVRSIRTKGYPYRIFKDANNGVICLSSSSVVEDYDYLGPKNIIIETVR